jgi:hypothetical protein
MITKDNMPKSYKPFDVLTLCSNRIIGARYLVSMGEVIPIILGQGDKPMVWLQAAADPKGETFTTVVEASISMHPAIKVLQVEDALEVSINNTTVLKIKSNEKGSASVEKLDMRPLGINMFGDNTKLEVGGMTLAGNSFQGVETVIALGK